MASETVVDLPKPGAVLHDKWVLGARLGQGGMATVFAATHRNGMRGAIKILHPQLVGDPVACARLIREGRVANTIDHPGVVRILDDDCTDGGLVYLVMELLDGETLKQRWAAHENQLPLDEVLDHAEAVLEILVAAHEKGVVHRDIKPDNVFLVRDGPLKLLDFGIARLRETGLDMTHTGSMLGTPAYMPPEQALAHWDEVDGRSDIFALGATMWTLLTGKMVHPAQSLPELLVAASTKQARPLRAVLPAVPKAAADLIDRALRFDLNARWPDAASMLAGLRDARRAIAAGGSEASEDPPEPELKSVPEMPTLPGALTISDTPLGAGRTEIMSATRPPPPSRRRTAALAVGGLAVGVAALFAATNAIQSRRDERAAPAASASAPATEVELARGEVRFAKLLRMQSGLSAFLPAIAALPDKSIAVEGRAYSLPDWGQPDQSVLTPHYAIGRLDAGGSTTDALVIRAVPMQMPGFTATHDGLVVAGNFNSAMRGASSLDFGCGPLSGEKHAFIASLSLDLTCQWAHDLDPKGVNGATDLAFEPETERIGLLGAGRAPLELGGTRIERKGTKDLVFASFRPDGSVEWATSVGSPRWALEPLQVGFIDTDALVASAIVNIDTMITCTPEEQKWIPCQSGMAGFPALVVADKSGITARRILRSQIPAKLRALDTAGDRVLVGGDFSDSVDLGGEPLQKHAVGSPGGGFFAIYDRSLEKPLLQRAVYGFPSASVTAVLFDADGGYFIAGSAHGTVQLPGTALGGEGDGDSFVAHYDKGHELVWAERFVGGKQTVSQMTLDQHSLYVLIGLEKSATFGAFALESPQLDPVVVALVP